MLTIICQIIIALGIYNVWLVRANRATPYRGGSAKTMAEEFAAYGLPAWFMKVVMVLKLTCATFLLLGLWYPALVEPGAYGMVILMTGAVLMHAKVKDEVKKSVPAAVMLLLSVFVATGAGAQFGG